VLVLDSNAAIRVRMPVASMLSAEWIRAIIRQFVPVQRDGLDIHLMNVVVKLQPIFVLLTLVEPMPYANPASTILAGTVLYALVHPAIKVTL